MKSSRQRMGEKARSIGLSPGRMEGLSVLQAAVAGEGPKRAPARTAKELGERFPGLLPVPVANDFDVAFEAMEIAEQEIARAGGSRANKDVVWRSFGALKIPHVLRELVPRLYRHHCRELIARAKAGEGLAPATKAEVLSHLKEMSLKRPPSQQFAALHERLFAEIMGPLRGAGEATREPWARASDELLAELRGRFAERDRQVKAPEEFKP